MVVVLAAEHVDVKRDARALRKRLEDVRNHLGREIADLLALELQVAAEVRARRDVEDGARKGLRGTNGRVQVSSPGRAVHKARRRVGTATGKEGAHLVERRKAGAVAPDALALAEGLLERLAEGNGTVLDRVVVVDLEVALALELERHLAVLGERVQHLWRCGAVQCGASSRGQLSR